MKIQMIALMSLVATALPSIVFAKDLMPELASVGTAEFTASHYKPGNVKHIVLFRYAAGTTAEKKREVRARFTALKKLALRNGKPYIVSLEAGLNHSGEGADQDLEDGYIVTFKSQGDRNFYVGQPAVTDPNYYDKAHQAFKDFVGPLLDAGGALVFDFTDGQ